MYNQDLINTDIVNIKPKETFKKVKSSKTKYMVLNQKLNLFFLKIFGKYLNYLFNNSSETIATC